MNDTINKRQFITMVVMFIAGTFIITNGDRMGGRDTWLIIIFGGLLSIPYALLCGYIATKNKSKTIYQTIDSLFCRGFKQFISFLFYICILALGIITARSFAEYIQLTLLPFTPKLLTTSLLVLACAFGATKSLQTIARTSGFLFLLFCFSFIIISVFSFSDINIENILPILDIEHTQLYESVYLMFVNPFSEIFIFLAISAFLKDKQSKYQVLSIGIFISIVVLSFNAFKNALLLGMPAYQHVYFPSSASVTAIVGNSLVERAEMVIASLIILSVFVRMMIIIKALNIGVLNYCKSAKESHITIFHSLLIIIVSIVLFKNLAHFQSIVFYMREWINAISLGLVVLIFLAMKTKRKEIG